MVHTNSGNTKTITTLSFQLLKNGLPYEASSIDSIKVYSISGTSTGDSAICSVDLANDLVATSTGLYVYNVPIITSTGTYYDVLSIDLYGDSNLTRFENSFTIAADSFTGGELAAEASCKVFGVLKFGDGSTGADIKIDAIPDDIPSINNNTRNAIIPVSISSYTNDNGYFSINIIKNTVYRIAIRELAFYQKILVPNLDSCELWQLTTIDEVGEPTAVLPTPPTGTETNNPTPLPQPGW